MITETVCQGSDLCQELSGSTDTSFTRVYGGDPPSRRISGTRNFELIADMSPLTAGHLLLLPKQHYLSFAGAIAQHEAEIRSILSWLVPRYSEAFSPPVILEHGSTGQTGEQACITHAHWHVLPVPGPAVDVLLEGAGLGYEEISDIAKLSTDRWTESPYYFSFHRERGRIYTPGKDDQRQYLRSVVGRVLAIEDPEWDYAIVVRREMLRQTMHRTGDWPKTAVEP